MSEQELKKVMVEESGMTPENAEKAAKDMMKRLDPDGDGKIEGKDFRREIGATADDLPERLQDKMGSSEDAFNKWHTDGNEKLSDKEFMKGAEKMGISKEAAEAILPGEAGYVAPRVAPEKPVSLDEFWKQIGQAFENGTEAVKSFDADGDGKLSKEDFLEKCNDLGIPPDESEKLFENLDKNGDGAISEAEFQNFHGVDPDKVQDQFLDKFGNAEKAPKANN